MLCNHYIENCSTSAYVLFSLQGLTAASPYASQTPSLNFAPSHSHCPFKTAVEPIITTASLPPYHHLGNICFVIRVYLFTSHIGGDALLSHLYPHILIAPNIYRPHSHQSDSLSEVVTQDVSLSMLPTWTSIRPLRPNRLWLWFWW